MGIGQALVLVLSFPAISALLLGVTVVEARLFGDSAASLPGNQPNLPRRSSSLPAARHRPRSGARPAEGEHATGGR